MPLHDKSHSCRGFTLIELSIVMVIIGLIVGGILVGQSLITAAGVRATITQIEKYKTAANTFYSKYGYLPGDIPNPTAASFGFLTRGTAVGQGDGNGVMGGGFSQIGENTMFWVDLSTARLIEESFSTATPTWAGSSTAVTGAGINAYIPAAKIGGGNNIMVVSDGWNNHAGINDQLNYYQLANSYQLYGASCPPCSDSQPGLTVNQAYSIDAKVDDGLPLAGNVMAGYTTNNNWEWGGGVGFRYQNVAPPTSTAITGSSGTCFDNGSSTSNVMAYSIEISGGSNINCALMFKF